MNTFRMQKSIFKYVGEGTLGLLLLKSVGKKLSGFKKNVWSNPKDNLSCLLVAIWMIAKIGKMSNC